MSEEKISLTMSTTSTAGKTATKSVTDINDNATDSELLNFASALNNMTTNTLGTVTKVTKREIEDAEELTNPIQSIAASTESAGAYTVTGSGTSYNVTVDRNKLLTALENDHDEGGALVSVNITLPNTFTVDVYNNKVHVDYGMLSSSVSNLLNGAVSAAPYNNEMTLFYMLVNYNEIITNVMNENESITIKFDSVTVSDVKYAAWQVTFTA